MIKFFIPLKKIPSQTAQQKGVRVVKGKPIFYTKPEVQNIKGMFKRYMAEHKPKEPWTGPIQLVVKWCYPETATHKKGEWKTTKPDTDNLIKLLKDCLEECNYFAKSDAQVSSEINQKFYNDVQGIFIQLTKLENQQ